MMAKHTYVTAKTKDTVQNRCITLQQFVDFTHDAYMQGQVLVWMESETQKKYSTQRRISCL